MVRRSPALTKQCRWIAECILFEDRAWPFSYDPRFEETGLNPEQIRDALWSPKSDEWRRDALARYHARRVDADI